MNPKKIFWIASIAQFLYWMLAALVFSMGQYLLFNATAFVAGLFITVRLFRYAKAKWPTWTCWLIILAAPVMMFLCYQVIILWLRFIDWTLNLPIPANTSSYNTMRFLDIILVSALIALAAKIYQKLKARQSLSHPTNL